MGNKTASKHKTEIDIYAGLCYRDTMALIKLRKNKRLAIVPKGVFRCILEY